MLERRTLPWTCFMLSKTRQQVGGWTPFWIWSPEGSNRQQMSPMKRLSSAHTISSGMKALMLLQYNFLKWHTRAWASVLSRKQFRRRGLILLYPYARVGFHKACRAYVTGYNAESLSELRGCLKSCRQKAKGATFFEATEGETARPMLDVCWAPMLGALSVLFEELNDGKPPSQCPNLMQARPTLWKANIWYPCFQIRGWFQQGT